VSTSDPFGELERMVEELDVAGHLREYTTMTNAQLVRRYNEVKEALKNRGEIVEPRTDTGRDLHSQHTALLNELHERNLR
jgi:phage regulator Rha-like protein